MVPEPSDLGRPEVPRSSGGVLNGEEGEPPRAIVLLDCDGHRVSHEHELLLGGQPAAVLVTQEICFRDRPCPALRYRLTLSADWTMDFGQMPALDGRGRGKPINPSVRGIGRVTEAVSGFLSWMQWVEFEVHRRPAGGVVQVEGGPDVGGGFGDRQVVGEGVGYLPGALHYPIGDHMAKRARRKVKKSFDDTSQARPPVMDLVVE